ncbi:MAG TPA: HAD family hydrolase [Candidatus Cloacimonetes bacterium]|nr:HAD family hydrolase [Candidatus Cloacimonadota bacterium]HEX37804.1 HAD family hydrolase [Candidatus Cloacimonadota bacterium]
MKIKDIDLVIFDMDGTLLKSENYAITAIQDAFKDLYKNHGIKKELPSHQLILGKIGQPSMQSYLDLLDEEHKHLIDELHTGIQDHEERALKAGLGELFEGAEETLDYLQQKGYRIGLESNCSMRYFNNVKTAFDLEPYLDISRCIGEEEGLSKISIISGFISKLRSKKAVVVGDRFYDVESGKANNCVTVGCLYGYGPKEELKNADYLIEDIRDLRDLL